MKKIIILLLLVVFIYCITGEKMIDKNDIESPKHGKKEINPLIIK